MPFEILDDIINIYIPCHCLIFLTFLISLGGGGEGILLEVVGICFRAYLPENQLSAVLKSTPPACI